MTDIQALSIEQLDKVQGGWAHGFASNWWYSYGFGGMARPEPRPRTPGSVEVTAATGAPAAQLIRQG